MYRYSLQCNNNTNKTVHSLGFGISDFIIVRYDYKVLIHAVVVVVMVAVLAVDADVVVPVVVTDVLAVGAIVVLAMNTHTQTFLFQCCYYLCQGFVICLRELDVSARKYVLH